MLRLPSATVAVMALLSLITPASGTNNFISPPASGAVGNYQNNPKWTEGQSVTINLSTNYDNLTLALYQQGNQSSGVVLRDSQSRPLNGSDFPWTWKVSAQGKDLTPRGNVIGPVFYFWAWDASNSTRNFWSQYFNISQAATSVSASTLPAVTHNPSGSGPPTAITAPATSTPTSTPTPVSDDNSSSGGGLSDGAKAGIGVGVAIAVLALIAGAGFWFWRHRRRQGTVHGSKEGPSIVKAALPTEKPLVADYVPVHELPGKARPHELEDAPLQGAPSEHHQQPPMSPQELPG